MKRPADLEPRTIPDIDALWDTYLAMRQAKSVVRWGQSMRWRIDHRDWSYLRSRHWPKSTPAPITLPLRPGGTPTLFGVPVDLIDPGPDTWPAMILVCDRRN